MDPLLLLGSLIKILQNPVWTALGVIVVGVIFLYEQRKLKGKILAYREAEIRPSPHPLHNAATRILWRVQNCGNEHIFPGHFKSSIEFTFSPHVQILNAAIVATEPPQIKQAIMQNIIRQPGKVELQPFSLDIDQLVTIEFWTSNFAHVNASLNLDGTAINVNNYCERSFKYARNFLKMDFAAFVLWGISLVLYTKYSTTLWYYICESLVVVIFTLSIISISQYLLAKLRYK